jgi:hypothetical protein
MSKQPVSGAAQMLVLCLLPIVIFYVLSIFGMAVSPLLVLILCCLSMLHWSAGACGRHAPEETVPQLGEQQMPIAQAEMDLFSGVL